MKPAGEERREFQRLHLESPIAGFLGVIPVTILEAGVLGARIRHTVPLRPGISDLTFSTGGHEVTLRCEIVRTRTGGDVGAMESGLRFVSASGDSGDVLRRMLTKEVTLALENHRSAPVEQFGDEVDLDSTIRGSDAAYLCYRLHAGVWSKRRVFLPEQPVTGFTVARVEDSEEMQRLCRIYQASDDEGRRLIRMFAELSVSDALQIPPRQ